MLKNRLKNVVEMCGPISAWEVRSVDHMVWTCFWIMYGLELQGGPLQVSSRVITGHEFIVAGYSKNNTWPTLFSESQPFSRLWLLRTFWRWSNLTSICFNEVGSSKVHFFPTKVGRRNMKSLESQWPQAHSPSLMNGTHKVGPNQL